MPDPELPDGVAIRRRHIREYQFDPNNIRAHTARNVGMIEDSLEQNGAARSLVADERDVVLCGNGTLEAAAHAGIEDVIEIETDGRALIIHKRPNLSPDQKRHVAVADNRSGDLAGWNNLGIVELQREAPGIVARLWTTAEFAQIADAANLAPAELDTPLDLVPAGEAAAAVDRRAFTTMSFSLTADQLDRARRAIRAAEPEAAPADITGNPSISANALDVIVTAFLALQVVNDGSNIANHDDEPTETTDP